MPALRDLQAGLCAALLGGDARAVAAAVRPDGLDPEARLAIYRHHVQASLTAALEATFPVVVSLVDARFFRYAADRYVRAAPPAGPCLFEYGATFPDFLARFPPVRHLAWLPDVARLEWALNVAHHAPDAAPLAAEAVRALPAVALHPSVSLLESPWPVDAIWRAHRPGPAPAPVDPDSGGARLQIWRAGEDVLLRALSPGELAFRAALARGAGWPAAAEAARAAEPGGHLVTLARRLLDEQVLIAA